MQHILEKSRKLNLPTFLLFISNGKACGNVNQGNTWQVLREVTYQDSSSSVP
jgi:hypothetical protein